MERRGSHSRQRFQTSCSGVAMGMGTTSFVYKYNRSTGMRDHTQTLPIKITGDLARNESDNHENKSPEERNMQRDQDKYMPVANIQRIMRKVLPVHAKISDEAKETMQECVSEYITLITGEANDRCQREQRKTVTAEDLLWAMNKLGFSEYIGPLSVFLCRYRQFEGASGCLDQRGKPFVREAMMNWGSFAHPTAINYVPAFQMPYNNHQVMMNPPYGGEPMYGNFLNLSMAANPSQPAMTTHQPMMGDNSFSLNQNEVDGNNLYQFKNMSD